MVADDREPERKTDSPTERTDEQGATSSPTPDEGQGPIVLFDGYCSLCCGIVPFLLEHDREGLIHYGAMQTPAGQVLLRRHGRPPDDLSSFVVLDRGQVLLRSTAVLRLVRYLRFPWPLVGIGWIVPRPLRDLLYDQVARSRYLSVPRREACYLPTPAERDR